MTERIVDMSNMEIDRKREIVRCRDCLYFEISEGGQSCSKGIAPHATGRLISNCYCSWAKKRPADQTEGGIK